MHGAISISDAVLDPPSPPCMELGGARLAPSYPPLVVSPSCPPPAATHPCPSLYIYLHLHCPLLALILHLLHHLAHLVLLLLLPNPATPIVPTCFPKWMGAGV